MNEDRPPQPRTPHDALFRDAFGPPERAASLFSSLLPAQLSEHVAWDTLERVDSSFIDPHLHPHDCDLLFSVQLRDTPAYIYLLLEHQSTSDRHMTLRMLSYLVRIWERHLRLPESSPDAPLPIVIPALVSHAEGGWRAPVVFHELFDPVLRELPAIHHLVPNFSILLDDLSTTSDDELLARAQETFNKLVYVLLRDGRKSEKLVGSATFWIPMVVKLFIDSGIELRPDFKKLLRYLYIVCDRTTYFELEAKLIRAMPTHENKIMTYGEELIEQGRKEGRKEGREQNLRSMLERLVLLKYDEPSAEQRAVFDAADPERLMRYIERTLSAPTLDELLAD